jgi:hypothetical protein
MTQADMKKLFAAYVEMSSWKDVLGALADVAHDRSRLAQKNHAGRLDVEQTKFAFIQGRMTFLADLLRGLSVHLSSGES